MNIDIKTADGEDIEFGGAYYNGRGTEYRVVGIRLIDYRHIAKVSLSCLTGKVEDLCCVSMRPNELYSTPPDSWEKLEKDLDKCIAESDICWYYSPSGECRDCAISGNESRGCTSIALEDIKKRICKLRGEGDAN